MMPTRPRLKAHYHVEIVDDTTVLLLGETGYEMLTGRGFSLLAPYLSKGGHTLEDLFNALEDKIFFPEISYVLDLAEAAGHLVESDQGDARHAAFWHSLGADLNTVKARLTETRVTVETLGDIDVSGLFEALGSLEIPTGSDGNFHLVVTDDYLRPELEAINRRAIAAERTWMMVRPVGELIWLGPVFRPRSTACWDCLGQRLRMNRQLELFLDFKRKEGQLASVRAAPASLPTTLRAAFEIAATEVAKAVVLGGAACLENVVLTLDSRTFKSDAHTLMRRAQCAACGDPGYARREQAPIVLQSHKKERDNDGGHRTARPEATYERLKHHVDAITGVVRNLEPTGNGARDGLTFSYSAGHNFAMMHEDLRFVLQNLRGRAGGKGMTDIQARVSTICEAIERYSAVYRGEEVSRQASYEELGAAAVHPYELMLFSESQYRHRVELNRPLVSGFHRVPEPFDDKRQMSWTPVYSLTSGGFRSVLSAYCYFGHPEFKKWFTTTSDSNGNAAGNTLEEAIFQGFLELVERDAVALWWYNRLRRPALDLDSWKDPYIDRLREHYRSIRRDLWVLDITSDLGIPTFAAVCPRTDHPVEDIVVGFGAHLDPRVALIRTLTEVNQFMPSVSRQDEKGNTTYWYPEPEALTWWTTATLERDYYLRPDAKAPPREAGEFRDLSTDDLKADVLKCVEIAGRAGLEVMVLDHTQPDIGLNAVKVMVPGLRHFWRRFGPGRLYDVPVKMGWLDKPTPEEQLNPVGIFF